MREEQFVQKNITAWEKLNEYNSQLKSKNISTFSKEDIREYAEVYRICGYHLSYCRTHFKSSKTEAYLNQLLGVSHNNFYIKESSTKGDILNYFLNVFPNKINEYKKYFYVSFLIFMVGFLVIFAFSLVDKEFIYYFFPKDTINQIDFSSTERNVPQDLMSSVIMTNNIKVSIMSYAFGTTAGIGTIYVLLTNGAMLGALTGLVITESASLLNYAALILPHGIIELTAIFISAGAGLIMGKSVLIPGIYSRKHAFVKSAKEAAIFIPGVATMLVVAGIIEGYVTPSTLSPVFKLVVAGVTLVILVLYFGKKFNKRIKS